jgi:hypothetical protein
LRSIILITDLEKSISELIKENFIKSNNGTLKVEIPGKGRGATFVLEFEI